MKTHSLRWLVGLGAVACSFASCSEPATECLAGLAQPFATVYTPMGSPSPAGCEMTNPKVVQLGDLIGFEWYHPPTANGTTYDDSKSTVAIKTSSMGNEYAEYNAGCTAATCAVPLPCAFVPAGDAGLESNGDTDCDPTGQLTGVCTDATAGGPCSASSSSCFCTKTTCAGDADCNGGSCVNGSCAVSCGAIGDGCGGMLSCGACPAGQTCGGGGAPNVCGTGTCTPTTCAALGANCGPVGDGCGNLLQCGSCTAPETCGGNGTPNACGAPVADPNPSDKLYSLGGFAQHFPDSNDLCQVTGLSAATQTFSAVPAMSQPTDTVEYQWINVNVYVTAASQGTQFYGDVTYTDNGCSATYHAVGMWPAVDCSAPVYDSDDKRHLNVIGMTPNLDACNPCSEPDKGRYVGSGISPDFPLACKQIFPATCTTGADGNPVCTSTDPFRRDPFYCVLSGAGNPPQLNPDPPLCN